ncbi:MAG: hypothetical protein IIA61_01965 [Candidatus Marinimicrobia bacterium]|nr:hypothetical protein [Candidatus Neomarinimicrobiota bacterium]
MKEIISRLLVLIFSTTVALPLTFGEVCEMTFCQTKLACCDFDKNETPCGMSVVEGESIPFFLPVAPVPKGNKQFSIDLFNSFLQQDTGAHETALSHPNFLEDYLDYHSKIPIYYQLHSLLI